MQYLAKINIGAGGTWAKGETKDEALKNCIKRAIEDWSGIYDIKRAIKEHEVDVKIYKDGGTDSFEDDTYIETVTP
jgi:predicted SpoU family rRNA methylase